MSVIYELGKMIGKVVNQIKHVPKKLRHLFPSNSTEPGNETYPR